MKNLENKKEKPIVKPIEKLTIDEFFDLKFKMASENLKSLMAANNKFSLK